MCRTRNFAQALLVVLVGVCGAGSCAVQTALEFVDGPVVYAEIHAGEELAELVRYVGPVQVLLVVGGPADENPGFMGALEGPVLEVCEEAERGLIYRPLGLDTRVSGDGVYALASEEPEEQWPPPWRSWAPGDPSMSAEIIVSTGAGTPCEVDQGFGAIVLPLSPEFTLPGSELDEVLFECGNDSIVSNNVGGPIIVEGPWVVMTSKCPGSGETPPVQVIDLADRFLNSPANYPEGAPRPPSLADAGPE